MFNLGTLDTVIALVVVLLVLSLIVQAIQSFIKKMFKLKSKEIEKSLTELFKNVIDKPAAKAPAAPPVPGAPPPQQPITPEKLTDRVLEEFNGVGRYTKMGRTILDSISKEDLLKILARVDSKHFFADYVTKFQSMYTQVEALEQEISQIINSNPPLLQGAASAKFAEMREVLAPLINDIKSLLSGNAVKRDALLGDLINLRRINLDEALNLLSQAQEAIAKDIQAERQAGNTLTVTALQNLSTALARIAGILGQLGQQADIAFAALRSKLDHVERWYDTVMQSFEERYTRHMKNVAIYISIVIVILLNASFFRIYNSISTNDQQRDLIVKAGEKWLEEKKASTSQANGGAANTSNNSGDTSGGNNGTNINASASPTPQETTIDDLKKEVEEVKQLTGTYESYGLSPLTWQQVKFAFKGLFAAQTPVRSASGVLLNSDGKPILPNCLPITKDGTNCDPVYRDMLPGEWGAEFRSLLVNILGWFITILLLSVGAPFWQDTLESLFGIKNLLRKKSNTQNVEQKSGEGQPRQ